GAAAAGPLTPAQAAGTYAHVVAASQAAAVAPVAPPLASTAVAAPALAASVSDQASSAGSQVVSVLTPMLTGAQGTHQISLQLHPEGLGVVDATVTVQAGHITVELRAESATGHQALDAALPQLRQELSGGGGQGATVLLSHGDSRGRQSGQGAPAGPSGLASSAELPAAEPPAGDRSRLSSIDLRL
ncbi:MAG: flagellar hook-length control protein FliK, partial [Acidobacteriota bacterium]|nr:flagellar hook-length control protein FliK [Acidobacteriota bacterium]